MSARLQSVDWLRVSAEMRSAGRAVREAGERLAGSIRGANAQLRPTHHEENRHG